MVYKVIGLMSGSSMDGLDIAYVQLEEVRGKWSFEILKAECQPYTEELCDALRQAATINVSEFLKLHTAYGRFLGDQVNEFIERHELVHKVHFIASHGHTVYHDPANRTTCQVGDGAAIAAVTGLPVISDLRAVDVALGGQGAPIVPIGDKLLFGDHDYLLNIGGIANITIMSEDNMLAFDVCPANRILNGIAQMSGKAMDEDGELAQQGSLLGSVLEQLNQISYYKHTPPKSLSNAAADDMVFPPLLESDYSNADRLHTAVHHIASQVVEAVRKYPHQKEQATLLVTGGGAFNTFLVSVLTEMLRQYNVTVVVPHANVVKFKEALVMALIGTLRWREETNVLSSVTGASRDSVGGALWLG